MTREETKNWAIEIINKIVHHHHHTQTFNGKVIKFINRKEIVLEGVYNSHKNNHSKINLYFPDLDDKFNINDEVEIIIKRK